MLFVFANEYRPKDVFNFVKSRLRRILKCYAKCYSISPVVIGGGSEVVVEICDVDVFAFVDVVIDVDEVVFPPEGVFFEVVDDFGVTQQPAALIAGIATSLFGFVKSISSPICL